jgi:glutamate formiminotransferase/glutamate formiminotransferase/formiminotetrahydrofolate cyclodeaminase
MNVSEGTDRRLVREIAMSAGADLLDLHADAHHNRAVLTVVGEESPRAVTKMAVARLDLRTHDGVHPRLGVVDVVPFVALDDATAPDAAAARDRFAAWASQELGLPCFLYGPLPGGGERTLPEIRRDAFRALSPDAGPTEPHPTAGAVAVGARPVLVAYNLWLASDDLDEARRIARSLRGPSVRALGLAVGAQVQVSMNLVDPGRVGPSEVWDAVAEQAPIERAELIGLVPLSVLESIPRTRWELLDLSPVRTIEARIAARAGA